jgi:hypothetical protein
VTRRVVAVDQERPDLRAVSSAARIAAMRQRKCRFINVARDDPAVIAAGANQHRLAQRLGQP